MIQLFSWESSRHILFSDVSEKARNTWSELIYFKAAGIWIVVKFEQLAK